MIFPSALNANGGAKVKLVRGYKGTTDILLAMERGEVDIVGAYGLPGMLVSHPGWIDKGDAVTRYQAALKRRLLARRQLLDPGPVDLRQRVADRMPAIDAGPARSRRAAPARRRARTGAGAAASGPASSSATSS